MPHRAIATLQQTLRPHVGLSKSRLETLCLIVVGMISARTVNLSHLACERPTTALVASTYRRLQRFFQHVRLGADWSAPLVVGLLGLDGPWHLALDRTQWKLGARDVNILMLAVVTRRARVPLIWSVLDNNGGASDSGERIALMRRYLAIFGAASVRLLLADREFVGRAWMDFLVENNIPFAIRMKEKLVVTAEDGRRLALGSVLRKCRGVRTFRAALGHDEARGPLWLNFAARRLEDGTLLIVASSTPARAALAAYRKRWAIECLFGDAKTRGLNLEDTRLVTPRKLALLLGLVALALAGAARTAAILVGRKAPARKTHGGLKGFQTWRSASGSPWRFDPGGALRDCFGVFCLPSPCRLGPNRRRQGLLRDQGDVGAVGPGVFEDSAVDRDIGAGLAEGAGHRKILDRHTNGV